MFKINLIIIIIFIPLILIFYELYKSTFTLVVLTTIAIIYKYLSYERTLKQEKISIFKKKYIYDFQILFVFLFSSLVENNLIGFMIYLIFVFIVLYYNKTSIQNLMNKFKEKST